MKSATVLSDKIYVFLDGSIKKKTPEEWTEDMLNIHDMP